MRWFTAVILAVAALPALAQSPQTPMLYASPDDVAAAMARSRAAATLKAETIVAVPPLRVAVEYRAKPTPASLHERNNELISVIDGDGTLIIGGKLQAEARRDDANLTGSGIEGGTSYALAKGSYVFIPAGVPHYFAAVGKNGLTISTIYIPK